MRADFHAELGHFRVELAEMCDLAADAMERAVRALLDLDLSLAEQVITDDAELDRRAARCDEHARTLLALQSPVARDLRIVVSGIRAAERLNRMGDLARHVAEIARRRHPHPAVPDELVPGFAEMGRLAVAAARATRYAMTASEETHADAQDRADDQTDRLRRELLTRVGRPEAGFSVQAGIDVALLTRYVERFADQSVQVTRQVDYVVTGESPHPS
jgi:phosphate transport system protein